MADMITDKQLKFLNTLLTKNKVKLVKEISELTKREAMKLIDAYANNKELDNSVKNLVFDENNPEHVANYLLWSPDDDESLPF